MYKFGGLKISKTVTIDLSIQLNVSVEQAINILENLQPQTIASKKEITYPYWCWNCKQKIEKEPPKDEQNNLTCPLCGVAIPEP